MPHNAESGGKSAAYTALLGRRFARVSVTRQFLVDMLRLPPETDVRHMGYDFDTDCLSVVIGHPALPEIEEGCILPRTEATCRWNEDGAASVEWPDLQTEVSVAD